MPETYLYLGLPDNTLRHLSGDESAEELAEVIAEVHNPGFSCPTAARNHVRRAVSAAVDAAEGPRRFKVHTMASPVNGICVVYVDYHPDADPEWLARRADERLERMMAL